MYESKQLLSETRFEENVFANWDSLAWRLPTLFFKTKNRAVTNQEIDKLCFEISTEKLCTLLLNRQICAADIRCLDANSKQTLKKLCLKTCLRNSSLT